MTGKKQQNGQELRAARPIMYRVLTILATFVALAVTAGPAAALSGTLGSHERERRGVGNHHERRRHLRPDPPHGLLRRRAPLGSGRAGRLRVASPVVK